MKRSSFIVVAALLFAVLAVGVANANILANGGFEGDGDTGQLGDSFPDGWAGYGWSGWHHNDEGHFQDELAIKMWWDDIWVWQDFAATAGSEYIASIDVMNSTAETSGWDGILKLEWFDADMVKLAEGGEVIVARYDAQADAVDEWVTINGSHIAPDDAVNGRYVICLTDWFEGVGGALNFDNATLVPEPATLGLLGLGGLFLRRRRK